MWGCEERVGEYMSELRGQQILTQQAIKVAFFDSGSNSNMNIFSEKITFVTHFFKYLKIIRRATEIHT